MIKIENWILDRTECIHLTEYFPSKETTLGDKYVSGRMKLFFQCFGNLKKGKGKKMTHPRTLRHWWTPKLLFSQHLNSEWKSWEYQICCPRMSICYCLGSVIQRTLKHILTNCWNQRTVWREKYSSTCIQSFMSPSILLEEMMWNSLFSCSQYAKLLRTVQMLWKSVSYKGQS